jgi:hypothetical protein
MICVCHLSDEDAGGCHPHQMKMMTFFFCTCWLVLIKNNKLLQVCLLFACDRAERKKDEGDNNNSQQVRQA